MNSDVNKASVGMVVALGTEPRSSCGGKRKRLLLARVKEDGESVNHTVRYLAVPLSSAATASDGRVSTDRFQT